MIESMRTGWLLVLTLWWSAGAVHAQQLTYVKSNGCGNIVLYGWTEDRTEAIIVPGLRPGIDVYVVFRRADGTTVSSKGPISLKAFVGFVFG